MTRRYSGRQLTLAKLLVLVIAAVIGGPFLASPSDKRGVMIAALFIVLALTFAAYEGLAHGIALALGRLFPPVDHAGDAVPGFPAEALPATIGLGQAGKLFAWVIASEATVWVIASIIAMVNTPHRGDKSATEAILAGLIPVALPVSVAASGLVLIIVLRQWRARFGPVTFDSVVAPLPGTPRELFLGAATGAALGGVFLVMTRLLAVEPRGAPDLFTRSVSEPGPARWAWIVTAVILAPPIEEILFRGALLGALRESLGLGRAAIASGTIFWLLHATEWIWYWPAGVSIGILTVLLTALRLGTRSLGPGIAAHLAYNLVLAAVLMSS
ncbi:MAG: CPBP family intramembrane glutamic endopeptidase [Gemmatimonadales bacterium]